MSSSEVRKAFAQTVQQQAGIESASLIHGLATIPREEFVGPGPWQIMRPGEAGKGYVQTPDADPSHIYDNVVVALDAARNLNNGEPSSLLGWLDTLSLNPGDKLLHVGCGVGYYTAIASVAVGPNGGVVGVEIDRELAERASANLRPFPDIEILSGDATEELPGPFDAIFINAGCTHPPAFWLDQMAVGGRLLLPLTVASPLGNIGFGLMLLVTRTKDRYDAAFSGMVGIFHCEGVRTEEANDLLGKALAGRNSHVVRQLRRDAHERNEKCWLHGQAYCLSG